MSHSPSRLLYLTLLWLIFSPALWAQPAAACTPGGYTKAELLAIKQADFEVDDAAKRNALALVFLACVADPDPELRDGLAFEGLANWLRAEKLSRETYQSLYAGLMLQLQAAPDSAGFRQPFAALNLSEVARADRLQDLLSVDQRGQLVLAATAYLSGVKDYRGYSATEGWRHGVAHGADLALQLVLNEHIHAGQVESLLLAVATQVAPQGDIFYIYGEPQRLARVVFYAYKRELQTAEFWHSWFDGIAQPSPMQDWSEAFSSQAGLAKRHNTLGFLLAMHLHATAAEDEQGNKLDQWVMQAISKLP